MEREKLKVCFRRFLEGKRVKDVNELSLTVFLHSVYNNSVYVYII